MSSPVEEADRTENIQQHIPFSAGKQVKQTMVLHVIYAGAKSE